MPKTYESLEPQGHFNFAKRVFQKIKGYIDSKVQTDVPANATFTDTKVTQTQDNSTNDNFEILLAGSTSTSTVTEGAKKTSGLVFNPSQQATTIGSRKANSTIGLNSFASGYNVEASASCAHAEGDRTTASNYASHAEGGGTTASEGYTHAEGYYTIASGICSHAEGGNTEASGGYTHAEGLSTVANHKSQHVFGEYNIPDPSAEMTYDRGNYVEIVGNGDWSTRSNARTLDWNGNEVLSGKLTVGTAPTNNMDVTTKQYVDTGLAGADEIIEITATDYDALSYAEKHNGKYYHITDRNSSNELDTKVTQTQDDSTNATYEVLLAGSTSATTATESAKKSSGLTYNPSTSVLSMSGTPSGNTDVVTKAYADGKVDKTGDTMTGDLNINSNNARTKYINPNMTLDTSANNGLSSDSSYGAYFTDKNGNAVGDVSMTTRSTGRNYAQLMARNKKTDGTAVTNYIDVIADKDGSSSYYVSNPAAFRSAIGLGSETGINGYFEWSTGSVSVPNATRTDVYQKTITVTGVYMVQFIGNWDKKAGGSRVILVAPNTKPQVNGGRRTSNTSFVGTESSLDWFQEHIFFQTLNAGDILYFCAYQNSGSTIAIYPIVNIIRIQ